MEHHSLAAVRKMDTLDSIPKLIKKLRADPHSAEIFGALSGAFFSVWLVSWLIQRATSTHWGLGVLLTLASGAIAIWIARLIFFVPQSISMVLVFFIVSVLLGAVTCASLSYILHTKGWATYNVPQQVTIETFRNYYLWTFLDMVPAINLWKTIPVKSPVEPADATGGAPVLLFRIFVLAFLFASIRQWWKLNSFGENQIEPTRQDPKPDETDSSAVGKALNGQDQIETEITNTDAGEVTGTHKPGKAEDITAEPENEEEGYILEREPDGRYRIVGRRPHKQK
jgi:hypothetical protein